MRIKNRNQHQGDVQVDFVHEFPGDSECVKADYAQNYITELYKNYAFVTTEKSKDHVH